MKSLLRTQAEAWGSLVLLAFLAFFAFPARAATLSPDDLAPGDLIRGESFSAVYYFAEDGLRYIFPNSKIYFTWYDNFDEVRWLSDENLATIQIGGNVTYKPGVKMVKINSSPQVYAVGAGGILRGIDSEDVARALYGENWNQDIDDLPDSFFGNYEIGDDIEFSSQYDRDVEEQDALTIDDDKDIKPFVEITITEEGYSEPTVTIDSGTAVRWINEGEENHTVTEWDRVWGSGTLRPDKHYTRYFREEGTWHYYSKNDDRGIFEGAVIVE